MIDDKKTKVDSLEKTGKPEKIEDRAGTEAPTFTKPVMATEPILETQTEQLESLENRDEIGVADAEEELQSKAGTKAGAEEGTAHEKNSQDSQIVKLESEVHELNDKLLRALAETENVRRRAQRDKEDAAKYGIRRFAENILSVSDNLSRALVSIDPERRADDSNLESLAAGIEIVMKDLLAAFEQSGIKQIEALGARFDPMMHEAMFEIEDADKPSGTIAQVIEDGFTLHGRTLRAAKVGVTKGGPKLAAPGKYEKDNAPIPRSQQEGQQTYESKDDSVSEAGSQVDQEL